MKKTNYTTIVFKTVLRMTLTLALLVLSLPTKAFDETLDNGVETFKYSLSGEVTNMGTLKKDCSIGNKHGNLATKPTQDPWFVASKSFVGSLDGSASHLTLLLCCDSTAKYCSCY